MKSFSRASDLEREPQGAARLARQQLLLVCATDFVLWLASGVIYPYLPLFLREDAHASYGMLGAISGAYFLAVFAFALPAGRLSDRLGRKPLIVVGTLLFAVATLLFLTTTNPWWFVAFRTLEGLGAALVMPASRAFVAEITRNENRSRAYGWLTSAQYGGLVLGPAVAWPLYMLAGGGGTGAFHALFLFGGMLTVVATALLALLLREPPASARMSALGRKVKPARREILTAPVLAIVAVVATSQYALGGFEVIWTIYMRELGASMTLIGLTWVLFGVPLLFSFLAGRVADRHSRFVLMFVGFGVQAVSWMLVPVLHDPLLFVLLVPIDGLAYAFAFPAKQAFLVQVSPRRWLGSVQGFEETALQFGAFAGTVTAPLIYGAIGGGFFAVAGLIAAVGLAVAAPTLHREWARLVREGEVLSTADAAGLAAEAEAAQFTGESGAAPVPERSGSG